MKVGSDFSGVGAFDQALKRLGVNYETVFACDMDKFARDTFIHNYGEPKYYPTNVYDREIPSESLDIYMTSPPCQAFSLAGKRLGKEDKRGILFFNSHEFIKLNKPRYFIFENVRGLLSDNEGKTFKEWINMLGGKSVNGLPVLFSYEDSVPYHLYYKVLNAKHHGVPQNRERVFLIGIRDDSDNSFQFPEEENLTKRLKDILDVKIDDKYFLSSKSIIRCLKSSDNKNMLKNDLPEQSRCIISGYNKIPFDGQYIKIEYNDKRLNATIQKNGLPNGEVKAIDTYNKKVQNESPTLTEPHHNTTRLWDGYQVRKLTPRECFRLMDFPDSFTWNVSDSQAYKQAGNSIVVNVLYKILKQLIK